MKNVKKLVGYLLCLTLVIGCISGCGGKSDEELLMSSVTNINKANSFQMDAKLTGKMSMKMGEESQDVEMDAEISTVQFADPMKAKSTMKMTTAGQTVNSESYIQKEADKYVIYTKVEDTWSKMSLDNLDEAMRSAGVDSMQKQLAEDVSKYVKKEDREEGDKKYLVYEYKITGEELKSIMNSATSSMGGLLGSGAGEQMDEIMDKMMSSIGDVVLTILIDREEENIHSIEFPMTDMMNNMMKAIMDYTKEQFQSYAGEGEDTSEMSEYFDQLKIEVSDMKMIATYSKVGEAEDFTIPQEALDAEEMNLDNEDLDAGDSGEELPDESGESDDSEDLQES